MIFWSTLHERPSRCSRSTGSAPFTRKPKARTRGSTGAIISTNSRRSCFNENSVQASTQQRSSIYFRACPNAQRVAASFIQVAKSNFRNGGANLPVCRDDPQVVAHHFGNFFWQSL